MSTFNENAIEVQKCIESMALRSRIVSFYPESVSRKLGIQLDIIIIELNKLCDDGILELKYEIKCTENFDLVNTVIDYKEYLGTSILCKYCGEEFQVEYNNIYPVYYIAKEYKEYVKKKQV